MYIECSLVNIEASKEGRESFSAFALGEEVCESAEKDSRPYPACFSDELLSCKKLHSYLPPRFHRACPGSERKFDNYF